jgi:O-antigen/teichoic acid export membrane protein
MISASLEIITQPSISYLQFEEKYSQFVIISLVTNLATLVSSIVFIVVLEKGILGLVQAAVVSKAIAFIIYFFIMVRSLRISFNFPLSKKLIRTGLPYVTGALCFFLIQYADRYMLEIYSGLKVVGIYSVGYSLGMMMVLFVTAFSSAWTPYFHSFVNNQMEAKYLFGKVLEYYLMLMGFLCLCMFLFSKPVVVMMTTVPYYGAHTVVGLIALAQLIYGCYLIFLPGLYYARKSGKVNLIIFTASFFNILLNLILIPQWDMIGATLATFFSFLMLAVFTHFAAKKYLTIQIDWIKITKYSICWGLCVALSYLIQGHTITRQVLIASSILMCFISTCYFILNDKEKLYLKKIFHNIFVLRKLKWKKC